jgi:dihydroorotate dehydrogenase
MDWYRALARPLFFTLPPEAAHRTAGALLDLPLPWRRIGHAVDDPVLSTEVAGIPLRNPIGLAAGFDKSCAHLRTLGALGFGYVVGGTVTREPRAGHPKPRIARYPERASMVNAMGLPNPGAAAASVRLRASGTGPAPRIVSLADESAEDALAALDEVAPLADGIELNASCPNVSWGRDRDNEAHLRELVTGFVSRLEVPLFVKLPPFASPVEREVVLALARIAQEAGADGLTCSNTRPVGDARVSMGQGGLSGRALWPGTVENVAAIREATGHALAVNACGGISSAEDVLSCLDAGAATVQIYSALIFRGPGVVGALTRELRDRLRARGTMAGALEGPRRA